MIKRGIAMIAIVDDDDSVRRSLRNLFVSLGFGTAILPYEAGDPTAALALVDSRIAGVKHGEHLPREESAQMAGSARRPVLSVARAIFSPRPSRPITFSAGQSAARCAYPGCRIICTSRRARPRRWWTPSNPAAWSGEARTPTTGGPPWSR